MIDEKSLYRQLNNPSTKEAAFTHLVREYQEKNCGRRYSGVRLHDYPRFDCIAGAFNMDYVECNSNEQLPGMIEEYLAWDRAALMVCNIAEENLTI